MFKRSLVLLVVLLALVAVPVSAQGPTVARLATVGVDDVTVSVGETFTVPVWIHGVSDLYGADVRVTYDNDILQGVRVDHGYFLQPDFVVRQGFYSHPSIKGLYARYALTQVNPTPPASGSGVFMIVHFTALQPGTVNLTMRTELATRRGIIIPNVTVPGVVVVK